MRIALVAGRIARHAWASGRAVRDLACGLSQRGHAVTLIAESVDDETPFERCGVRLFTRRAYIEHASRFPIGFRRWSRCMVESLRAEARGELGVLLLTHLADRPIAYGDRGVVCAPVDLSARVWIDGMRTTRGLAPAVVSLARHLGAVPEWFRTAGAHEDREVAAAMTHAPLSTLEAINRDELRKRARDAMSIADNRLVVLASSVESAPMGVEPSLGVLLEAAERVALKGERGDLGGQAKLPLVLVLAHQLFRVHRLECAGNVHGSRWRIAGGGVRLLGTTERPEAALAACDVVAMLPRAGNMASTTGQGARRSRLACDALWMHKRLIGSQSRVGDIGVEGDLSATESQEVTTEREGAIGKLVPDRQCVDADGWQELLEWAIWREQEGTLGLSPGAIARIGTLQISSMLERVEWLLEERLGQRKADAGS